jgi:hypothetical protein
MTTPNKDIYYSSSLVARSHEYIQEGYKTDHGGSVVTVHSAPEYRKGARGRYLLFQYTGDEEGLERAIHNGITYFVGETAPAGQ